MDVDAHLWEDGRADFIAEVSNQLKDKITCLQCGTCTGSCPVAFAMDYPPRDIIRMLQTGEREKALASDTIWVCSFCNTCYTRCPGGVNIPEIMTVLKNTAMREGASPEKKERNFYRAFAKTLEEHGRLFEPELGLRYGLSIGVGRVISDLPLGIEMLRHGKLPILPHRIKNPGKVSKMMTRIKEAEGE
ncbi:succinate dehydrogenase iron-sulfur subunit [archaeon BMS3Abin16]|nr:succinate dehydrogenase iron-sulfur subunit [archaeon BMS3Abin16]